MSANARMANRKNAESRIRIIYVEVGVRTSVSIYVNQSWATGDHCISGDGGNA